MSQREMDILGALVDGEGYGLGIHEALVKAGKVPPTEDPASYIHPMLRGLEAAGLLSSRDGEPVPERGNRPRRYYSLTEAGRRAVELAR